MYRITPPRTPAPAVGPAARVLGELVGDPDPQKARRVTEAMLQMKKIDIAGPKKAYEQG